MKLNDPNAQPTAQPGYIPGLIEVSDQDRLHGRTQRRNNRRRLGITQVLPVDWKAQRKPEMGHAGGSQQAGFGHIHHARNLNHFFKCFHFIKTKDPFSQFF